ncbi:ABC transporter ATP-binding protein [Candidatus Omnitrophota bacterium]
MIRAENVNKVFKQGTKAVHAVEAVSMRVAKGERVYIHGPSGAGKSTLLQVLGGLSQPTEGRVIFDGKDIYGLRDSRRSRIRNCCFGFIFQFYYLLPELNVLENVMLPAIIKGESPRKARPRAMELVETVGMAERLKHRPSQLSGGEAQRTAVARALVNSPEVLFCDEPTGNLDSEMGGEIYALIRRISENSDMSVMVVSHQEVDKDFFHTEYRMKDGVLGKMKDSVTVQSTI